MHWSYFFFDGHSKRFTLKCIIHSHLLWPQLPRDRLIDMAANMCQRPLRPPLIHSYIFIPPVSVLEAMGALPKDTQRRPGMSGGLTRQPFGYWATHSTTKPLPPKWPRRTLLLFYVTFTKTKT